MMTSILSDIAGFGRSSGLFERSVTRERFPVLSASYDASAALARGSALLIGGLDGTLGQTIRSLSLTTPRLTLGSPLRFGSFQTGALSRGLWSGGMPMFPFSGGMWPGMMGAGGMFGAPAGSYAGGHNGGSPGYTTPRRLMAQDRSAPAAGAATDTAASTATPATKSGTTAAAVAAPAGAGKTGPTLAEKKEQQWKKAAERVVTAVQKDKGLKDAISVTVHVVGRTITVTPKPGATPSENKLIPFVAEITKLVNGKSPLGGSSLVIGGKKYDGKTAVAELVKALMPAAPVVVKGTPSVPASPADSWAKAAQALEVELNKMMSPDAVGDENVLSVAFDVGKRTITVTTDYFPADADCANPEEVQRVLTAAIQAVNGPGPLKGSSLIVGAKTYKTCSAADIADMLKQFETPAPSLPSRPTATTGDPDTKLTPEVLADNARFAHQVLNEVSEKIPGFMYSWQFGPAKELVMAKIAQIKSQLGLAADAAVPPEKAEAVARALFAFAQEPRPNVWPPDAAVAQAMLANSPPVGLGLSFAGNQGKSGKEFLQIVQTIDQPAEVDGKPNAGECSEQTAVFLALNAAAKNPYVVAAEVFATRVGPMGVIADKASPTFHICAMLRAPGTPDIFFDLG